MQISTEFESETGSGVHLGFEEFESFEFPITGPEVTLVRSRDGKLFRFQNFQQAMYEARHTLTRILQEMMGSDFITLLSWEHELVKYGSFLESDEGRGFFCLKVTCTFRTLERTNHAAFTWICMECHDSDHVWHPASKGTHACIDGKITGIVTATFNRRNGNLSAEIRETDPTFEKMARLVPWRALAIQTQREHVIEARLLEEQ